MKLLAAIGLVLVLAGCTVSREAEWLCSNYQACLDAWKAQRK